MLLLHVLGPRAPPFNLQGLQPARRTRRCRTPCPSSQSSPCSTVKSVASASPHSWRPLAGSARCLPRPTRCVNVTRERRRAGGQPAQIHNTCMHVLLMPTSLQLAPLAHVPGISYPPTAGCFCRQPNYLNRRSSPCRMRLAATSALHWATHSRSTTSFPRRLFRARR